MPYLFGMYIKSKEEREQEYQEYFKSIFPWGERQKEIIQSILKELVPEENPTMLLLYFIQLREKIAADSSLSPLEAEAALPRRAQLPKTVRGRFRIHALLEADAKIDSSLSYPGIQELILRAEELERADSSH